MAQPDAAAVREYILKTLRDTPTGASTRFTLAEGVVERFGSLERDEARSLVGRALATMQEAREITLLRPESWDFSGDERVRLL